MVLTYLHCGFKPTNTRLQNTLNLAPKTTFLDCLPAREFALYLNPLYTVYADYIRISSDRCT